MQDLEVDAVENSQTWTERPAGFWIRLLAFCVDGLLLTIPVRLLAAYATPIGWILGLGAGYVAVTTAVYGQTPGQKIFGLQPVRTDGTALTWPWAWGRSAAYLVYGSPLVATFFPGLDVGLEMLSVLLFVVLVVAGLFSLGLTPEKRALHDFLSGSKVLRAAPLGRPAKVTAWTLGALLCAGIAFVAFSFVSHARYMINKNATPRDLRQIKRALEVYAYDHEGKWPLRLEDMVGENGKGYLDAIPFESITRSSRCTAVFDGKGGWFYDPKTRRVQVNVDGQDRNGTLYRDYGSEGL